MNTAEAITFSILVGSAVGMILVGLAVVIVAATTPTPRQKPVGGDTPVPAGEQAGEEARR